MFNTQPIKTKGEIDLFKAAIIILPVAAAVVGTYLSYRQYKLIRGEKDLAARVENIESKLNIKK